jgi:hypothetical protein
MADSSEEQQPPSEDKYCRKIESWYGHVPVPVRGLIKWFFSGLDKASVFITAAATVAIFWIAILQWQTFKKTDHTLKDTLRASIESQRAFLLLKDVQFAKGDPSSMESSRDLVMIWKNVGRHVAQVTAVKAAPVYGVIKKNLPEILATQRMRDGLFIIPPVAPESDVMSSVVVRTVTPPVEGKTFIDGLRDGSIPLWFVGTIDYKTGYPIADPGQLGFCMIYVPPFKRLIGGLQFTTCEYPEYTYTR